MILTIPYSTYKKHYSDCRRIPGTYNEISKSISIEVPEGRMKNSGVRNQKFRTYELFFIDEKGKKCYYPYRAVSKENAIKQLNKDCKKYGWIALDEEGKVY